MHSIKQKNGSDAEQLPLIEATPASFGAIVCEEAITDTSRLEAV